MDFLKRFTRKNSRDNGDVPPNYYSEDALHVLRDYDIVFIIDDSGSMAGPRWKEAGKALSRVAEIASQYDPDGIDIYFLNSREFRPSLAAPSEVEKLFQHVQPYGPTPTGDRLDWHLNEYMNRFKKAMDEGGVPPKPVNYIVITDGVPTDDPRSVIVQAARRMDAEHYRLSQVGIQFIQVGDDSKATKALKELDDGLSKKERIRDFVDTTPYKGKPLTAEMIIKILLGGINRRVDNKGGASVMH